jgi:hypothetical protein
MLNLVQIKRKLGFGVDCLASLLVYRLFYQEPLDFPWLVLQLARVRYDSVEVFDEFSLNSR